LQAREPEIEHLHATVAADDRVVGLEVAVHHAGLVRGGQPRSRLHELLDDLVGRPPVGRDPPPQRLPLDELHRHEQQRLLRVGPCRHRVLDHADVVDRHHVGVRELGQRLRLAEQSLPRSRSARRTPPRTHDFERDLAVELGVVGGIDDSHPAAAHPKQHHVPPELRACAQRRRLVDLRRVFRRQPRFQRSQGPANLSAFHGNVRGGELMVAEGRCPSRASFSSRVRS
jgi:hypothetical protein